MLAWILFVVYMIATLYLGWLGYHRTRDFGSFAIGSGDLHPFVVGITLAASVASAATFIINPGFIYVHGLAAFMHFVVAVGTGFCLMLIILSFRFRRLGEAAGALTMPHWIGQRYASPGFAMFFALVNLFALAFVVLIVGGLSIVMQQMLGISNTVALLIILLFVTGYVFLGGTYAHAFTNTLQGSLMIGVTMLILASGIPLVLKHNPGFWEALRLQDPDLVKWVNPSSNLYNNVFSIYISGLIIGAALVCQPHILTKALYVRSDRAVRRYLIYGLSALVLFFLLPTAGFYARVLIPPEQIVDAATGAFRQDLVMTMYIKHVFPGWLFTVIGVVLLAAGMSTLDGLLVSLSTITANDLVLYWINRFSRRGLPEDRQMQLAYRISHLMLVAVAVIAFVICLNPPRLLGIFGQVGVYGMAVAAVPPLLGGVLFRRLSLAIVWTASALAMGLHFVLYFWGEPLFPRSGLTFANPGVPASLALLVTVPPTLLGLWWLNRKTPFDPPAVSQRGKNQPQG